MSPCFSGIPSRCGTSHIGVPVESARSRCGVLLRLRAGLIRRKQPYLVVAEQDYGQEFCSEFVRE